MGQHNRKLMTQVSPYHIGLSTAEVQRLATKTLAHLKAKDPASTVTVDDFSIILSQKTSESQVRPFPGNNSFDIFGKLAEADRIKALSGKKGFSIWHAPQLENSLYMRVIDRHKQAYSSTEEDFKKILGYDGVLYFSPNRFVTASMTLPEYLRTVDRTEIYSNNGDMFSVLQTAANTSNDLLTPGNAGNVEVLNGKVGYFSSNHPAGKLIKATTPAGGGKLVLADAAKIRVYLNNKALVEDIDYIVHNATVYIINTLYLKAAGTDEVEILTIHDNGGTNKHIKHYEYGFVAEGGFYSQSRINHSGYGHQRILAGQVDITSVIPFSYLDTALKTKAIYKPYSISRPMLNMDAVLGAGTSLSEYKRADDMYARIEAFRVAELIYSPDPAVVPAAVVKYRVVSPYVDALIPKLISRRIAKKVGDVTYTLMSELTTNAKIDSATSSIKDLLKIEPQNYIPSRLHKFIQFDGLAGVIKSTEYDDDLRAAVVAVLTSHGLTYTTPVPSQLVAI
jgi:hypothetical protein